MIRQKRTGVTMTPIDERSTLGPTCTPPMVAGAKRIRGTLAGKTVVDSRDFMFVWEVPEVVVVLLPRRHRSRTRPLLRRRT